MQTFSWLDKAHPHYEQHFALLGPPTPSTILFFLAALGCSSCTWASLALSSLKWGDNMTDLPRLFQDANEIIEMKLLWTLKAELTSAAIISKQGQLCFLKHYSLLGAHLGLAPCVPSPRAWCPVSSSSSFLILRTRHATQWNFCEDR